MHESYGSESGRAGPDEVLRSESELCGIWYTIPETTSQFTFANSESTKCNQKLIVCMYDREYAVQSTEFDIVEQGHVPILMSLPQCFCPSFQLSMHKVPSTGIGTWRT